MQQGNLARTLIALLIVLAGCGDARVKRPSLIRVRGVVTFDGKPLPKAVIVFESEDGSFSYAETDRRGRYDLRFDSQTRGTTVGTKIVRISMNRRIRGLNSNSEGGPGDRAGGKSKKLPPEMIPERYHVHSSLKVEITSDTKRFDFDLKSQLTPAALWQIDSAATS
jgi:hypothetical protein